MGMTNPKNNKSSLLLKSEIWTRVLENAKIALKSGEVPVGAVLCQNVDGKRKILLEAHNQATRTRNPLMHAEILILKQLEQKLQQQPEKSCEFISQLEIFVNMEPCLMCIGALRLCQIPQIYFSLKNPRFGACGSVLHGESSAQLYQFVPKVQVLGDGGDEQSLKLLKEFYSQTNYNAPE